MPFSTRAQLLRLRLQSPARRRNSSAEWPGLPKVSRQVLGDVRGHLEHIEARNRKDGLERRVRLDGAAVVQRVLLDVRPDGLGYFGARHLALTADRRQLQSPARRRNSSA